MREGAEGPVPTAAAELRLSLPGFSREGKSIRTRGTGQTGFGRQGGASPPRPGIKGEWGPAPSPRKDFQCFSRPPRQDGDVDRGGARAARPEEREGRREEAETKRRPPGRRGRPGAKGVQGRWRRTRPAEGTGLLFLVVRAAGALHGESVPAKP